MEMEMDNLFESAMKGRWNEVVEACRNYPGARQAKITRSEDTALHIAVSDGQTEVVQQLVAIIEGERNASQVLSIKNEKGNTALHLAAALGNVAMCQCMAVRHPELIRTRNDEGETPLFLSVLRGKKEAYLCLHFLYKASQVPDNSLCRKSTGDTILHSAISGEYFSLAFQIIHDYPDLVSSFNESGLSPLHILASKSNVFKSGSILGLFDRIIYHCTHVDELAEEKQDGKGYLNSLETKRIPNYPANYETSMNIFKVMRTLFQVLTKTRENNICQQMSHCLIGPQPKEKRDEENPQQRSSSFHGNKGASTSASKSESQDPKGNSPNGERSNTNHDNGKHFYPPNYATCARFFRLPVDALLIILGIGISRIKKIEEKKKRHKWATQIMNLLIPSDFSYKYDYNGRNPKGSRPQEDEDTFQVPTALPVADSHEISQTPDPTARSSSLPGSENNDQNGKDTPAQEKIDKPMLVAAKIGVTEMVDKFLDTYPVAIQELNTSQKNLVLLAFEKKEADHQLRKKETPILIAAKMGVPEIVEKILETFPVAVQDLDADGKNIVLLAVEYRQTDVYKLLLNRTVLKESAFCQLDSNGNSALHLAAKFGENRPWLIPGAALQMQWEIKWYKFVRNSMPAHFFVRYNKAGQTPKEIFTETHKDLLAEGGEWMTKTAESCSVVAALIATVAFATSATVPGGNNQDFGTPILGDEPAFNVFAISSLVALCFSVTALVFFLAILTSRYQARDFARDLPRKLLLGLTSLFTSIASVLLSFCAGHYFILKDNLRYAAYPIYAATCLPVTFFALAQLPLYFDLVRAILNKVPQRGYKH